MQLSVILSCHVQCNAFNCTKVITRFMGFSPCAYPRVWTSALQVLWTLLRTNKGHSDLLKETQDEVSSGDEAHLNDDTHFSVKSNALLHPILSDPSTRKNSVVLLKEAASHEPKPLINKAHKRGFNVQPHIGKKSPMVDCKQACTDDFVKHLLLSNTSKYTVDFQTKFIETGGQPAGSRSFVCDHAIGSPQTRWPERAIVGNKKPYKSGVSKHQFTFVHALSFEINKQSTPSC